MDAEARTCLGTMGCETMKEFVKFISVAEERKAVSARRGLASASLASARRLQVPKERICSTSVTYSTRLFMMLTHSNESGSSNLRRSRPFRLSKFPITYWLS